MEESNPFASFLELHRKVQNNKRKSNSMSPASSSDKSPRISSILTVPTPNKRHTPQHEPTSITRVNGYETNNKNPTQMIINKSTSNDEKENCKGVDGADEPNHNSAVSFDDDLYGDLETSVFASRSSEAVKLSNTKEIEDKLACALNEIEILKSQHKLLSKENKAYARNISSLFATAKNEIDKKNFLIKQLQTKLQHLVTSKNAMSKTETDAILQNCQEALKEANSQLTIQELTKAIQQMQHAKLKEYKNQKQFIVGNMSLLLCRSQVPFQRNSPAKVLSVDLDSRSVDKITSKDSKTPPVSSKKNSKSSKTRRPQH